jgi:sugar/nucleoside kinase (ribokinase family)
VVTGPGVTGTVIRFGRLLHLGNVVIDVVLDVPALPERGGDVLASGTQVTAGGGFNVMAAAVARGLPVGYAGGYGSGPFAALALAALRNAGVEVLLPPKAGVDTGFVVTMVDSAGERTFVTSRGAEVTATAADLASVRARPADAVYLSGYGLLDPGGPPPVLDWLGRLGQPNLVFFDPGPLVASVPGGVLDRVLRRADWLTCNAREAALLTGCDDPPAAARALAVASREGLGRLEAPREGFGPRRREGAGWRGEGAVRRGGVLVRTGPDGCLMALAGAGTPDPVHVPGFRVPVLDTNGAGDTHTGTFIAALAGGADAVTAARTANAAAALSVTRRGPATAPSEAELARFLAARQEPPSGVSPRRPRPGAGTR